MMTKTLSIFLVLTIVNAISACVPVAVGAGASIGVAAAQEGGIQAAATDAAIRLQIHDLWIKHSFELYSDLDMTVKEGRVLITGSVPTADMRVDAIRLAWQADGVRQVINEVSVDAGTGVTGYVTDTWVTGNLKSRFLLDKYVQSINYNVDTVGGTVYLMGIAQDQKELNRVVDYARNTRYVKNVVSYVRLRGETPAGIQEPTTRGTPSYNGSYKAPARQESYSAAQGAAAPSSYSFGTSQGVARPVAVESVPLN